MSSGRRSRALLGGNFPKPTAASPASHSTPSLREVARPSTPTHGQMTGMPRKSSRLRRRSGPAAKPPLGGRCAPWMRAPSAAPSWVSFASTRPWLPLPRFADDIDRSLTLIPNLIPNLTLTEPTPTPTPTPTLSLTLTANGKNARKAMRLIARPACRYMFLSLIFDIRHTGSRNVGGGGNWRHYHHLI
mmetsp:Transcript_42302/g.84880  ORF Transcript_42302/g.84880 Transcript_42302/m.84880 type:complete len:188 (+) Transcript_42302:186-749(+)